MENTYKSKKLKKIVKKLIKFRDKRNWKQFHSGFTLSHKLQIESAEVAELFEWNQEPVIDRLKEEIADVLIIILYLCNEYKINFLSAINDKIEKNKIKYPVDYNNPNWRSK